MLYWAATVFAFGVVALGVTLFHLGSGSSTIGFVLFGVATGIAAAMAFTHWLCKRNDWR